jgi:hypothetical protein
MYLNLKFKLSKNINSKVLPAGLIEIAADWRYPTLLAPNAGATRMGHPGSCARKREKAQRLAEPFSFFPPKFRIPNRGNKPAKILG